ncbi:MAG: hypothetical protein NZ455_07080 [Bacteroidia bacterium]|nr:hypothetical protein [Bacteroidia bacterium]MDW8345405.1 hypothetical protein [Bacteroidia bacterium]
MQMQVSPQDIVDSFQVFVKRPCEILSIQALDLKHEQNPYHLDVECSVILPPEMCTYLGFVKNDPIRLLYYMGRNLGLNLSDKYIVHDYHFSHSTINDLIEFG